MTSCSGLHHWHDRAICRFVGGEDDYFRLIVSGRRNFGGCKPAAADSDLLSEIDGNELSSIDGSNEKRMRLDDLYLLPGNHFYACVAKMVSTRCGQCQWVHRQRRLPPPGTVEIARGQSADTNYDSSADSSAGITEREPNNAPIGGAAAIRHRSGVE